MEIYRIDPILDHRWEQFLQTHPGASVFHTPAWLNALRGTYGYEPTVFSTAAPTNAIRSGLAFCRVQSWLTGSRLVSLPFADHCQPLFNTSEDGRSLAAFLPRLVELEHCDYVEVRLLTPEALGPAQNGLARSAAFLHHALDLRPPLPALFDRLHKSCFQRRIRRAEKEGLTYAEGTSDSLLRQFYSLLVLTRRRHGVPPQPLTWFRNLRDCFGDAIKIGVASKNSRPIASMLTLQYKTTVVYKYGCSDAAFHRFGAMPFLFWQTIQRAKAEGSAEFDLGRSDVDDWGLIAFKNHLGAAATPLTYYRYPAISAASAVLSGFLQHRKVPAVFAHLPSVLLKAAGNLLYRHIG
jgi:CelD/BcsL family acetyltransferase involved in cellulose biosynthesis